MSLPEVASDKSGCALRKALLVREKELTRQKDSATADRRRLPMVAIEKHARYSRGPRGRWTSWTCLQEGGS